MSILDIANCIIEFIRLEVSKAQSRGVVLGLSGGVDSSVAVSLATQALGNKRVLGLILPDRKVSDQKDIDDAVDLSKLLDIKYHIIEITEIKQKYIDLLPVEKISVGNLTARIRMTLLYYYANLYNKLVLGTVRRRLQNSSKRIREISKCSKNYIIKKKHTFFMAKPNCRK